MKLNLSTQLKRQVMLLSMQFLLGMAVNLIGLPSETQGPTHTATTLLLGLHVLVALGLFTNGLILNRLAASYGSKARRLARLGTAGIVTAMAGGLLTLTAPWGNVWSYMMAAAFLAVFGFYGQLLTAIRDHEKG